MAVKISVWNCESRVIKYGGLLAYETVIIIVTERFVVTTFVMMLNTRP